MKNDIGVKLKNLRKGRGLTQQQLSEQIGLSRCTISNYECQRRLPHLNELRLLCDFFGCSLDYFGVSTEDETFELLSRAKNVFLNKDIPKEERERLYKEIMRMYLDAE
jgi:transcriptional regulator with XRE-family HTH domain